jgi:hypothetical protein
MDSRQSGVKAESPELKTPPALPYDVYGGREPEDKAAEILQKFFTFIAVRIVLNQIGGETHQDLTNFYFTEPMQDADEWLEKLTMHNQLLAARVMEVRRAYADEEFEWDWLQKIAMRRLYEAKSKIMHTWVEKAYAPEGQIISKEAESNNVMHQEVEKAEGSSLSPMDPQNIRDAAQRLKGMFPAYTPSLSSKQPQSIAKAQRPSAPFARGMFPQGSSR